MSTDLPADVPAVDSITDGQPRAGRGSNSRSRRPLILIGVFVCLVGVAGFLYWRATSEQAATDKVVRALTADGVFVHFGPLKTEDIPYPSLFQAFTPSRSVQIHGAGKKINANFQQIGTLSEYLDLTFDYAPVTDADLALLQGMSNIHWLKLRGTRITDAGIKHLAGMQLETLDVSHTDITDAGLATLGSLNLPRLTELAIEATRVTDEGVKHLDGFRSLEWLAVGNTKITKNARHRLKAKIPELTILGGD